VVLPELAAVVEPLGPEVLPVQLQALALLALPQAVVPVPEVLQVEPAWPVGPEQLVLSQMDSCSRVEWQVPQVVLPVLRQALVRQEVAPVPQVLLAPLPGRVLPLALPVVPQEQVALPQEVAWAGLVPRVEPLAPERGLLPVFRLGVLTGRGPGPLHDEALRSEPSADVPVRPSPPAGPWCGTVRSSSAAVPECVPRPY